MSDVLPLAQLLAIGIPAFVIGVFVGVQTERRKHAPVEHRPSVTSTHKEPEMSAVSDRFRLWYDRWAPAMVTAVAILAVVGIWIGAAASVTNGQQDRRADTEAKARDRAFSAVQKCFDRYAQAQSSSSSAVREASVIKDQASARFNETLNQEGRAFKNVVRAIISDEVNPVDVSRLLETLQDRDRAGRDVERAQAQLDQARADNPVPDAPSTFCSVKP